MLAQLKMFLKTDSDSGLHSNKSSLLHGVIMENIDSEYAKVLHTTGLNPFTSNLVKEESQYIWTVTTLNKEAYEKIIQVLLSSDFNEFVIKHNNLKVQITDKRLTTKRKSELIERFYHSEVGNQFQIRFITPTSFKSNGQYVIYPDIPFIFKNLMNKYNASSDEEMFDDEDTFKQIVNNTKIIRYNLRTTAYNLEGVKIPSFVGNITIKVSGTDTIRRFIRLLLEFGEYSGIGIKCSLGMGGVELLKN